MSQQEIVKEMRSLLVLAGDALENSESPLQALHRAHAQCRELQRELQDTVDRSARFIVRLVLDALTEAIKKGILILQFPVALPRGLPIRK